MKRKTLGFALLLFANVLAIPEALYFYLGLLVGAIGLWLVITGIGQESEEEDFDD